MQQYYLPIKELKADKDKVRRLLQFQWLFENLQIYFKQDQEEAINQLVNFPNVAHDDMVDSISYALLMSKTSWFDALLWKK